jgi:hypothetical protein
VFVVFLDTHHTTIEDETSARVPLVRLLDRLLDRDDLVALTTPSWRPPTDVPAQGGGAVGPDAGGLELGPPRAPPRARLERGALRPVLRLDPRRRSRPRARR